MINRLLDTLKSINDTIFHDSLEIDSLYYQRCSLLTLGETDCRLSQIHNGLMKLESDVSTINILTPQAIKL